MSSVSRHQLICTSCRQGFGLETNTPLQSSTCGHSICDECLESGKLPKYSPHAITQLTKAARQSASENYDQGGYFNCPLCHSSKAFHPKHSKTNLLALAAIELMIQSGQMKSLNKETECYRVRNGDDTLASGDKLFSPEAEKKQALKAGKALTPQLAAASSTGGPENASPARTGRGERSPHQSNPEMAGTTPPLRHPSGSKDNSNDKHTTRRKSKVISPSPEKVVFVKLGKGLQLAYLLSTEGRMANIRWESSKYIDSVPLSMIEAIEDDIDSGSRSKKRSLRSSSQVAVQGAGEKKRRHRAAN